MAQVFIVNRNEEMNIASVNVPPHISVSDGGVGWGSKVIALRCGGVELESGIKAFKEIYPDIEVYSERSLAGRAVRRKITPHKGGRTVKKSTDVTPETAKKLTELHQRGISLGDIIAEAVDKRYELK